MFIDTHCHLDYLDDLTQKMADANEAGVNLIINPSTNATSIDKIRFIQQNYFNVFLGVGIYPTETIDQTGQLKTLSSEIDKIDSFLQNNSDQIVAIGECGLDFSFPDLDISLTEQAKTTQIQLFKKHIDWALKYKLPLIIHNRKANQELLDIITQSPQLTGVFHCFAQGKKYAKQILTQTNFYLGLGGLITTDLGLAQTVKNIPLERIVLETDSPYLVPKEAKMRSSLNEPAFLVYTAQKLAQIKNISIDIVAEITTNNAKRLFSIK